MNSAGKHAIAALLILSIAGCAEKKTKVVPPAQAQAPSKDAGKAGALYPPPLMSAQPSTEETETPAPEVAKTDTPPAPPPQEPNPKKTASSKKPKPSASKPATSAENADGTPAPTAAAPPPPPTPAQTQAASEMAAASGEPSAASPIGQLSTGGAAGQTQTHKDTADLIKNTENGVNTIKHPLSAQEQETMAQIKTFLIKARKALDNDDFDGASTLATKAKLLLDELNKD